MKIVAITGGLGNQMFQYGLYLFLKNKYNSEKIYLDTSFYNVKKVHNNYELKDIFNINVEIKNHLHKKSFFELLIFKIFRKILYILKFLYIEKKDINVKKNLEAMKKRNIFFYGNWISEKYFIKIQDEVRKNFSFPKISDIKNLEIEKIIQKEESVSIHVRRGDYLLKENRVYSDLVELPYYEKAIKIINSKIKKPVFFIFSNDIKWCKENLKIKEQVYYIDWNKGKESYRDMQLMSLCKHNIIPHSTFSWWGAWLNKNPNKIVIAPKTWFNPKYLNKK